MTMPSGMPTATPNAQPVAILAEDAINARTNVPSCISSFAASSVAAGEGINSGDVYCDAIFHRNRPHRIDRAAIPIRFSPEDMPRLNAGRLVEATCTVSVMPRSLRWRGPGHAARASPRRRYRHATDDRALGLRDRPDRAGAAGPLRHMALLA